MCSCSFEKRKICQMDEAEKNAKPENLFDNFEHSKLVRLASWIVLNALDHGFSQTCDCFHRFPDAERNYELPTDFSTRNFLAVHPRENVRAFHRHQYMRYMLRAEPIQASHNICVRLCLTLYAALFSFSSSSTSR